MGRLRTWLPKLSHPIRIGEHNQTAFSLGLMIDWARGTGDRDAQGLFERRARELYLKDRAWMLEGIAAGLPPGDERLPALRAAAASHRDSGLAAVTGEHYEGGHWLGSFATYLATGRGLGR